jgi:hypothetical protein
VLSTLSSVCSGFWRWSLKVHLLQFQQIKFMHIWSSDVANKAWFRSKKMDKQKT